MGCRCDNGKIISSSEKKCNGRDDCGDNSDEQGCGELRCGLYLLVIQVNVKFYCRVHVCKPEQNLASFPGFRLFSTLLFILQAMIKAWGGLGTRLNRTSPYTMVEYIIMLTINN